jgi:gamma-glutamylcyclotransferase
MPRSQPEPRRGAGRNAGPGLPPGAGLTISVSHGAAGDDKIGRVLYFAYGSNLDGDQMRSRCPSARLVGRAVLANHALTFGGFSHHWGGAVASVLHVPGARVEGLLYQIDEDDVRALDRFEGHPFAYERVAKVVVDERGRRRRAALYRQPEDDFEPWPPPQRYFDVLWREYARLGFDAGVLATAAGVES